MPRISQRPIVNAVTDLIQVLGGPTKAALTFACSGAAIHQIAKRGRVQRRYLALRWASVARSMGRRDLTADKFLGEVPWTPKASRRRAS